MASQFQGGSMVVMTDEEVSDFFARNKYTGIKINTIGEQKLHYNNPEADCIELDFPETPMRATYFARKAALLGTDFDESMFYGAMLWITLYDIGSPQLEKTGWKQVELMRQGFGDNRPLNAASGHWFRNGESVELSAFLVPCFVFAWDAYIVPSRGNFFIRISHDQNWTVITRDKEDYKKIWDELKDLNPREGYESSLRTFCPGSSRLDTVRSNN
jgi:hypothetical protein